MMRETLARRVWRLNAARARLVILPDATRLGSDLGVPAAVLLADAAAFAGRCRAAGAITRAEIVALAAAEQGRDVAELWGDLEAAMARWGG